MLLMTKLCAQKLLFQLYENGHASYLIVDDRISKLYNEINNESYFFNFLK